MLDISKLTDTELIPIFHGLTKLNLAKYNKEERDKVREMKLHTEIEILKRGFGERLYD